MLLNELVGKINFRIAGAGSIRGREFLCPECWAELEKHLTSGDSGVITMSTDWGDAVATQEIIFSTKGAEYVDGDCVCGAAIEYGEEVLFRLGDATWVEESPYADLVAAILDEEPWVDDGSPTEDSLPFDFEDDED